MNPIDMTEIQYSVSAHRHKVRSEINDSHAMQKRWLAHLGSFLTWIGIRLLQLGRALQATSPKVQLQNSSQ